MYNTNNKNSREIISTIQRIKRPTDVNGREFLILELDNDKATFVFSSNVNSDTWNELEENQTYHLEVQEGKKDSNVLISFFKKVD